MKLMPRRKLYVVFIGRVPGVYDSWAECQRQVMGFLGNSYQSYPTREEAEETFQEFRRAEEIMLVRIVELEAERGEVQRSSDVQVEEISTLDGVY